MPDKPYRLKHAEDYYVKVLLKKVKLSEIMSSSIISVRQDAHFSEVAEKIIRNKIRHLPIVDEENKLVGLISERDLYKIQSPHKLEDGSFYYDPDMLDSVILSEVMIKKPFSLHPENTVAEAILNMVQFKYGCILVVDKNNVLCGIVTYIDILKIAAQILMEK